MEWDLDPTVTCMILSSGQPCQDSSRSPDIMDMEMTTPNVPQEIRFTKSIDMALVPMVICMTLSRSNFFYCVAFC